MTAMYHTIEKIILAILNINPQYRVLLETEKKSLGIDFASSRYSSWSLFSSLFLPTLHGIRSNVLCSPVNSQAR